MIHRSRHNNKDYVSPSKSVKREPNDNSDKEPSHKDRGFEKSDLSDEGSFSSDILDDSWISATSTYNYMMKDPLLDWLKHHYNSLVHKHRTYRRVVNKCLKESKSSYNFTAYIMEQGVAFEKKVMKLIIKKFGSERVAEIHGELAPRDPIKVKETLDAMRKGIPIIHSGVLHNPQNKTFGIPDLLIRSDWLNFIVDDVPLAHNLEIKSAPKLADGPEVDQSGEEKPVLRKKWHYRVVDIKFTGLLLRADAIHLLNSVSFPAYKAQLLIYNWALGYMQGYTPDQVYILGRRWKYTSKGETYTGNACFDKLGIIDYSTSDEEYIEQTENALKWLREVRSDEAADWDILNYPLKRWELYPNMCNAHDYPWHAVKENIADQTKELTNLWMVGPRNRKLALQEGISQWTDKDCTPEVLGITGERTSKILDAIIKINRSDKQKISPKYISNNIGSWKQSDTIEFFVDFETCNGVVSSIKRLPAANTKTIVFMIGVGYIDPITKQWIYRDFTVNRLTFEEEARICCEFSDFILSKSKEHRVKQPRCIHWAQAEDVMWTDAVERHNPISDSWKSWMWNWLDLLVVFKEEPIVINGCMSFGLKDVASAMKKHGFIKTSWNKKSVCVDGQSAMIAARKAHNAARDAHTSMKKIPVMKQIIKYNEVDVKVLYEIITYLRKNHLTNIKTSRKRSREPTDPDDPDDSDLDPKKKKTKLSTSVDKLKDQKISTIVANSSSKQSGDDTNTSSEKISSSCPSKCNRKRKNLNTSEFVSNKHMRKSSNKILMNNKESEKTIGSILSDMNNELQAVSHVTDTKRYNLRKRPIRT